MSEFVEYLKEVFAPFGAVQARRMFGGYGIYRDGIMFGLVENDILYFKADETTAQHFESRGLDQFEYSNKGKTVKLIYYQAPEEIFDSPEEATLWARRAFEVALLSKSKSKNNVNKRRST